MIKKYKNILFAVLLTIGTTLTSYAEEHHEEGDVHEESAQDNHDEHDEPDDHDEHGEEEIVTLTPEVALNAGVISSTVKVMTLTKTIPLGGKLTIDENRTATIRSRFSGVIKQVKVNLGDVVNKGQLLGTLYSNDSLSTYNIISSITGTVMNRKTNLGDVIENDELFTISDLTSIWAQFHVFPSDASKLNKGQHIQVMGLSDKSPKQDTSVTIILPTADTFSQTVIGITPVKNDNYVWRVGLNVKGLLTVGDLTTGIAVPITAIQTFEDNQIVFIKEGNIYAPRPIKTGVKTNDFVEVLVGLSIGEEYVSSGSFVIKADLLKSIASHNH